MRALLSALGAGLAAGAIAYVTFVEVRQWNANASLPRPRGGSRALLVLGCPPKDDGSLGDTQRWRVTMALRSWRPGDRIVVSGAAGRGLPSEADVMGDYARARGVPSASIVRETRARTTRENVLFSTRALADADDIMIISDPLHALRARVAMREFAPDLSARVVSTPGYRIGEHPWPKTLSALYESPLRPILLWAHRRVHARRRAARRGRIDT